MTAIVRRVSDRPIAKLGLFLLLSVWGTSSAYAQIKEETTQQTNQKIEQFAQVASTQRLDIPVGPGDLLHFDVFEVPELSRDVRVSATGEIGFPLIPGRIHIEGLTASQVEEKLEQLLLENGLVSHPQVTVFVRELNSQPITVMGAVARPSVYQMDRPMTLLEILARAGGIADAAGSEILITRARLPDVAKAEAVSTKEEPGPNLHTIKVRLQDLLETANSVFNIPIYGGDVVNIPPAGIVYVVGTGVAQPGGYVLQSHGEQITVLKAVALAHGLAPFSKKDDAVIYRVNPTTGEREAIPVHIGQIEKDKSEDVAMKSNDILYVPLNEGKKIAAQAVQLALAAGVSVAVYRAAYQ